MEELTIRKAASRPGVGIDTIRFYERKELIPRPPRPVSGYRQYPAKTVLRIRFIKRAKELGFTLKEIKDLLEMRIDPSTTCEDILSLAETKIVDIDGKIETLKKMRKALMKLTAACNKRGPMGECPIIDFLDWEEEK